MKVEYYIDVFCATDRKHHFWSRIKAKNGQIVWTSEVYRSKQGALRPVKRLIKNVGEAKCVLKIENVTVNKRKGQK